jgi:hypothetical protein
MSGDFAVIRSVQARPAAVVSTVIPAKTLSFFASADI